MGTCRVRQAEAIGGGEGVPGSARSRRGIAVCFFWMQPHARRAARHLHRPYEPVSWSGCWRSHAAGRLDLFERQRTLITPFLSMQAGRCTASVPRFSFVQADGPTSFTPGSSAHQRSLITPREGLSASVNSNATNHGRWFRRTRLHSVLGTTQLQAGPTS